MRRVRDGFTGQKILVLPEEVSQLASQMPIIGNLCITDIGYFPTAHYHYVNRKTGIDKYILIYCVDGRGWYELEGSRYTVTGGQYFILPAGSPHAYGADRKTPWTIYWFHFMGRTAAPLWDIYYNRHFPQTSIPFDKTRNDLFDKLYDTLEKGYSLEHLRFTSLSLGHLINTFLYPKITEQQKSRKTSSDMVDRTIEYMQRNLSASISLKQLAKHINYSIPHFASEFKKKTGYSAIDYHNRLRIQKACQYLDLSDMQVKEVAFVLGFKDPYYFSRLFSKIIGKSPRTYQKEEKNFIKNP